MGNALDGRTAVHLAAQYGHAKVLKLLCAVGGDVTLEDHKGHTPVFLACNEGCVAAVAVCLATDKTPTRELVSSLGHPPTSCAYGGCAECWDFPTRVERVLLEERKKRDDALFLERAEEMRAQLGF